MAKHAGIAALLAAAISQLAVADNFIWETEWEDVSLAEPDIHVEWGVDWDSPFVATTNRTLLCHTPESPSSPTNFWTLSEFQATSLEFRLLGIGDGSWEDGKGWLSPRWLPVNSDQLKIWIAPGYVSFGISASDIPLATFGDWNVADDGSPAAKAAFVATRGASSTVTETEILAAKLSAARVWYEQRWGSQHAVCLLVDTNQVGMAHVFSPEPWNEGSIAVSNTVMLGTGTMAIDKLLFREYEQPGTIRFYNNAPELIVKAERKTGAISGCAFIGEQVPPWCIWLADCGLTDAELSQWPDKIVQFAFEQHIRPDDRNILKRFQSTLFLMR